MNGGEGCIISKALQVLVWNPELPPNTTILNIIDSEFCGEVKGVSSYGLFMGNKYRSTE